MVKKQLIMEKALELFAKKGFEATSVQQITDYCGISKGAFYLSFKSKDELIQALIDHFMNQFISHIDYEVKNTKKEEVFLVFYQTIFKLFQQHSNFAKLLLKEQIQSFNEELLIKMRYYDSLLDKTILFMISHLESEHSKDIKYDLTYSIKGLINTYSTLFLFNDVPLDIELLSRSLSEKTYILARHSTTPFITTELYHIIQQEPNMEPSKEEIIQLIDQCTIELNDSIEKQSLQLIRKDLINPEFRHVIIKGLIENIRHHPHCKWISYLLEKYYSF